MEFSKYADVNPKCGKVPNSFYYIDLECVNAGEIKDLRIEMAETAPSRAQRLLTLYDILFQTVRPYQKNNYHFKVENDLPTVASTGYAVFRTEQSSEYLYELIHTERFLSDIMKRCTGTSFPAVSSSDIEDIAIWIPGFQEQKKIGDFLTLVDTKIAKQRLLIEHLKKYKRGLHQRIFCRLSNSKCEKADLRSIATFCGGGTPSKDVPSYWNGNIGWISSSDIHEEWVDAISVTRKINDTAIINSATKLCPPGTIAIVSRVGVGKVALMSESLCTSQDFTNITSIKGNPLFMAYQIAYKMKIEATKTQGTSIKGITAEEIKSLKVDIPADDEQCYVATLLSSFDVRLRQELHKANCLHDLKNALLQQLFI